MNRPVRSTRKSVSYDEDAPPTWVRDPWIARVKGHLDSWAYMTVKERLVDLEPFFEAAMSSPECVAYYFRFRDTMAAKILELSAEAWGHGVSIVPLHRRVIRFLKGLKELDCYRATPKYVRQVPMGIPVVMGIPMQAPAEIIAEVVVAPAVVAEAVAPPAVVAEVVAPVVVAEVVVAPAVVAEVVVAPAEVVAPPAKKEAPSMAEEIAAMVLHKVGALERELADRKRAHEEDMATLLALITEKDARISELEARLRKVADALAH